MMNRSNFHLSCRLFKGAVSCLSTCKPSSVPVTSGQRWQKHGFHSFGPATVEHSLQKAGTQHSFLLPRRLVSEKREDKVISSSSSEDADLSPDLLANAKPSFMEAIPEDDVEVLENSHEFEVDILEETENPEILEHFSDMPLMPETYTLASYVDHSETLQKLVHMGMDLSKVQSRKGVASMLMKMDFDRDIKDKLAFLHHIGIPGEQLGWFITKNPFILGEDVQNLEARVHYLLQNGFSEADVSQIVCRSPYFLNFSVERIDNKLGYFQQLLRISDSNVREIITRCPKLVTMTVSRPKENLFVLEFQCGFSKDALRSMVLKEPAILLRGKFRLIATFDYLHNVMEIPHKLLLKSPQVFLGQVNRVKDRHKYLTLIGRNQYNPKDPGYVPLMSLFKLPDEAFCKDIARTSLQEYERFLKTSRT
ncbi:transcription termination factor 3, mitochondrial [Strongylocentrotus purpuratus]|uniref:Transcription termination factor 3, mitochondrial n=1 Tax=Strongylocentrotus purpuratus TaxID=7668 RepID=A0A7M7N328_STRPU|nr:transcription termination factor 3, mitochondrial [Strongylocentrotus purpuratus]XP_030830493.1 transcription termination factor 3, mitochondrial [Strongylocentrotus purpuratus]